MKIKKYLLTSSPIIVGLSSLCVVSCSSSSTDYKVMSFALDENKIKKESTNASEFNNETNTKEKLLKIVKNNLSSLDRYTLEALGYSSNDDYQKQQLSSNIFEKIAIENNELIIQIKSEIKIKEEKKYLLYRLPNNSTELRMKI